MMKKTLLSLAIFVSGMTFATAQTDQSTVLLGGGISFETSDGVSIFRASPNVGLFVLDDVAVSARFSLFASEGTTSWAIGPSIRLYLFGSDSGKMITQVGVNVGGAKNTDTDFGFEVGAGYAVFLNESIALELLMNYIRTGDSKGIFSIGAGFQLHYDR